MQRDRLALGALLVLVVAFAAGVALLARARYTRGDGYPPGSSYRTDPLGTRALHDALGVLPGRTVARHTGSPSDLRGGAGTAVLLLGAGEGLGVVDPDLVRAIEAIALAGGRVIVSLQSSNGRWPLDLDEEDEDEAEDEEEKRGEEKVEEKEQKTGGEPTVTREPGAGEKPKAEDEAGKPDLDAPLRPTAPPLGARWGFVRRPCPEGIEASAPATPVKDAPPDDLPWRGGGCLELGAAWRPLYTRGSFAAVAERPLGRGTLLLLADGYVLSNEALLFDRRPAALAALLGTARSFVFEESHHGVRDRPGVAALIGRYGLGGALATTALLFALWVWWAATPLLRAGVEDDDAEARVGREAAHGLVSLLRRGLAPRRLMESCVTEWRASFAKARPAVAEALARMPLEGNDLPAVYRRARQLVNPGGRDDAR